MKSLILRRKNIVFACVLSLCMFVVLLLARPVNAEFDNGCKVGVHLLSPSDEDFKRAAQMINANGGKYCWITVVVREDEMTTGYLQRINNFAREYNFQVIYRLEKGILPNGTWALPDRNTAKKFIAAMEATTEEGGEPVIPANLDIVISIGNEPEHSSHCDGCTPQNFADVLIDIFDEFDAAEERALTSRGSQTGMKYFVGGPGHDLAAPQKRPEFYDAEVFIREMVQKQPQLPCRLEALFTHNYPRSFNGPYNATGRLSPRGYQWESSLWESLASSDCKDNVRNLPIFVKETGYKVGNGGITENNLYPYTRGLLSVYQDDPRVKAVTLFAYTYCGEPFDVFALSLCNNEGLRPSGQALYNFEKAEGSVRHLHSARTILECPEELVANVESTCTFSILNTGTDIWSDFREYTVALSGVRITSDPTSPRYKFPSFGDVFPGESLYGEFTYNPGDPFINSNDESTIQDLTITLKEGGRTLLQLARVAMPVFKAPNLTLNVEDVLGRDVMNQDGQVQIFNTKEQIVYRSESSIEDGTIDLGGISGVTYDSCYRIVLLVEGSLPVQKTCITFEKGDNTITMPRLLEVDRNNDGKLTLGDFNFR